MDQAQLEIFYKHKSASSHGSALQAIYDAGMLAGAAGFAHSDAVPTIDGPFGADAPLVSTGPSPEALALAQAALQEAIGEISNLRAQLQASLEANTLLADERNNARARADGLEGSVRHLENVITNLQTPQADKPVAGGESGPTTDAPPPESANHHRV